MRKITLPLILLLCFHTGIKGQSIRGRIVDSTQSPVPFATVALLKAADSSVYKGTLSDEKGIYFFEQLQKGNYFLRVQTIGYEEQYSAVLVADSSYPVEVPDLLLRVNGIHLNEVAITAIKKTVEFKNGNVIVNVENSPLAKGNTVYDLFSRLPGVSIDNNSISLQGKSGVTVMIDGRPQQLNNAQLMNLLRSMNAEQVEKIEVLKNPPVKYDASGTSGMINIKTKKTKQLGFSGTMYSSCSQGFYPRSMSGLTLNFKAEKVLLSAALDYNNSLYRTTERFEKKFGSAAGTTTFNGLGSIKSGETGLNYRLGADYLLSNKNTLGFKIDGGPGSYTDTGTGTNTVTGYSTLGFDHLGSYTFNYNKWMLNNYNVNAEHKFDTLGSALNFAADYTTVRENDNSCIENHFRDTADADVLPENTYNSSNNNGSAILSSRLDYNKVLDAASSVEAGAKVSFVDTRNDYLFERKNSSTGEYYKDTALSNNYRYNEQTYALYVNYKRSWEKLNIQLGLRGENTSLKGRNIGKAFELKRDYYNVFPTVSMEYTVSDKHNFQLNLNRRIDRPQYDNLNPFRIYRDQYSYYQGNPFLLPHYSNAVELTHSYKQSITNSFSFTRIDNVMLDYTQQNDSTKVTTETIKNTKSNTSCAYSFTLQHDLKPWWQLSGNGLVSYLTYEGDINGVNFNRGGINYYGYLNNTFIAPENTKIEIVVLYRGPRLYGITQIKPRWMLSLAVKKSFLNNKLDCSMGVNDIFYTFIGRSAVKFSNQDWTYRQTNDTRRLVLSVNYNFGKLKLNKRETSSNEQEKERLGH